MSMKRKIYILTIILVSFTVLATFGLNTYLSWKQILHEKYEAVTSIATLLDESLVGTYDEQLTTEGSTKEEEIHNLNQQLQPLIDRITHSYPDVGAGYYVKDLNSIVAFGPDFKVEELRDIDEESLARTVYKTKEPYEFHSYSQTRKGYVVANIRPIIRDGEVIGHVWGNILMEDVYSLFLKDIDKLLGILFFTLIIAIIGTNIISNQYIVNLRDFRQRIKNLDFTQQFPPEFSPELMEIYKEVVSSRSALVESEKRFRDIVTASDEFVWEVDIQGNYTYLSDRVTAILGYEPDELIGKNSIDYILDEYNDLVQQIFKEHVQKATPFRNLEYKKAKKNGTVVYLSSTSLPIFDEDHQLIGFRGSTKDITLHKQHEENIRYLAYYDQLTQLPNRSSLTKDMNKFIKNNEPFAIVFIDFDQFKNINDSLGHSVGDELLIRFAKRLQELIPLKGNVYRFGGDEFILLLKDFTSIEELKKRVEQIMHHVKEPILLNDLQLFITLSIGISIYPTHGNNIDALIKKADMAMYKSKANGRKQYTLFTEEMKNDVNESFELSNDMNEALIKEQFILNYQPQVDLKTGKIVGVEALVRWLHPTKGMISPAKFIPIAEDTGLIIQLGTWILRKACLDRKHWLDMGVEDIRVAVNISIKQFQQENFCYIVQDILNETGLDARYLELEITESIAINNQQDVIQILEQLKSNNIFISIDDFGTGYSSLNYLKDLPIDQLKVDRSFINDIVETNDYAIIQSIITMAQNLELSVVAEGIETIEQAAILKSFNYPIAQGFLYYKPMPEHELIDILLSKQ